MGNGFSVRIDGRDRVKANARRFTQDLLVELANSVLETAIAVQVDAVMFIESMNPPAVATGELRDSIQVQTSPKGSVARVVSTAAHAPHIEYGTRPHFPPLDAIRAWCRIKGIPETAAYPIALKIAKHGTPERPFMRPAWQVNMRTLDRTIKKNFPRALRSMKG